jgi:hypothetical protein
MVVVKAASEKQALPSAIGAKFEDLKMCFEDLGTRLKPDDKFGCLTMHFERLS